MKLSEFLTVYSFAKLFDGEKSMDKIHQNYQDGHLFLPRIYCNDGFDVSIQIGKYHYCTSENGIRQFGLDWKEVEWGYPSTPLTDEKYKPEDPEGDTVGGYVPIEVMEELIEQHGGIDLKSTLTKYLDHE